MKNWNWKKGTAAAVLGLTLFAHAGAANAATNHKAADGDTFWKLSKRYGVTVDSLMKANPKVNAQNIYEGLNIIVPSGSTMKAAAAAPAAAPASTMKASSDSEQLNLGGRIFNYTDAFQVKASAYTSAASENGGWGAVDYFGNPLKLGTIAVDPKRIPLGSKVYVTGYDYDGLPVGGMIMTATDMGGAIKGNRIDIYVPHSQQQARTFGFQYVDVFVLE
ncbi:3D domain-containing protein [Paenibacillus spongiae]|uniref:LysM peptidoglycan-binding domain-containing protein n=1 Tax=Paenibacillus spongiae TaxID=2909671 RepID=A0ABY5SG62_9BACL|nr:3D domain-containing protein [Paenibacillus spongiae]UVI31690.1 LysM peptidoglycan-binding domain-containing protein [Paenibacillus spongiae]